MTQEKEPEILWHYTTLNGFINIVENKTLHFGNIHYMNDPSEGYLLRKKLGSEIKKQKIDEYFSNKEGQEFSAEDIIKNTIDYLTKLQPQFVFSFSSIEDSLEMWRAYSGDANGFAIGFNRKKLLASIESKYCYKYSKVFYLNNSESFNNEDDLINKFISQLQSNEIFSSGLKEGGFGRVYDLPYGAKDEPDSGYCYEQDEVLLELSRQSLLYKDIFYENEKEYRLVLFLTKERNQDGYMTLASKMKSSTTFIKPYYEFEFKDEPSIISDVTLAPGNTTRLSDLRYYLHTQGIKCDPRNSNGLYRSSF